MNIENIGFIYVKAVLTFCLPLVLACVLYRPLKTFKCTWIALLVVVVTASLLFVGGTWIIEGGATVPLIVADSMALLFSILILTVAIPK